MSWISPSAILVLLAISETKKEKEHKQRKSPRFNIMPVRLKSQPPDRSFSVSTNRMRIHQTGQDKTIMGPGGLTATGLAMDAFQERLSENILRYPHN